ncbi:MAG: glycosyltransferase family 4 protein [Mariprofundaceae bacterium]
MPANLADELLDEGMNLLVVSDVSAEQVLGGAERMLTQHLLALSKAGHRVTLLTRQPDENAPLQVTVCGGVTEYRLPYHGHRGWQGLKQLRQEAGKWWLEHSKEFDAVIAEQPFTMWALIKAGCNLPRLQVCYSFAFEEYLTRHAGRWNIKDRIVAMSMRYLEGTIYRSASGLLVLSRYTQQRMQEVFGLGSERITISPGGVDLPNYPEMSHAEMRRELGWRGPVVVTLRNLVPRTGVDLLIGAAGLLKDKLPELHWCIIGQGAMLKELCVQAEALGVADRVEFTGYLAEEEVKRRLFAADLFMLPTRDLEGFGLVTLEANACGLPVIATPVTANKEVVPSLPLNRLADAVTAPALADAVRSMLVDAYDEASRELLRSTVEEKYAWKHHDADFVRDVEELKS